MVTRIPSRPLMPYHTLNRRSVPVVERPDSETHWTCTSGPFVGATHHMKFPQNICRHCGVGAGILRDRARRLQGTVVDEAGHRWPLWQVTKWEGRLVYMTRADGTVTRTYLSHDEMHRLWTLLGGL